MPIITTGETGEMAASPVSCSKTWDIRMSTSCRGATVAGKTQGYPTNAPRLVNDSSDTMSGKVRYFIMAKWMSSRKHRRSPKKVEKAELEEIIRKLPLGEIQKETLRSRWLHQVLYWNKRADESRWKYYALRSMTAISGAIIPALVSLKIGE